MDIQIVRAEARYFDSHWESLDLVSRERQFLSFLEGPPLGESRDFLARLLAKGDTQFYAVHEGKAIGWCDIQRKGLPALAHSGILGMGIRREYRGKGLGSRLIRAAIEDAEAKGLSRIELWVADRNETAKALYLKYGFKVEGRMERYLKIDGVYRSVIMMARCKGV